MKILQVHNKYQNPGGEAVVVASEYDLLTQHGDDVYQWIVHNDVIKNAGGLDKAKIALNSIWSSKSQQDITKIINEFKPDVVHVHNTMPLLSPAIYSACHKAGVAVVQTLHNFRTICPGSPLYRDGKVCEDCVGKSIPYPGMIHGCFRESKAQSAVAVANLSFNRFRGTYRNDIDVYVALTEFARGKFISGGLPADKIMVKPNFVTADIEVGQHDGGYALFVGRLVPHKGIQAMVDAWRKLDTPIPLKVLGGGPLDTLLKEDVPEGIEFLGFVPREEVMGLMQNASLLLFPSEWYEGFPMTITEAFATGLPVLAGGLGGPAEIVRDGESGWHFTPGDSTEMAQKLQEIWADPDELKRRGQMARQQFDDYYTPSKNYEIMMDIYQTAINRFKQSVATS